MTLATVQKVPFLCDQYIEVPSKDLSMPVEMPLPTKNPRRVAAGKLNRLKRKGLTLEGRERLRQSAREHQPWRFSTGPRTPAGKLKSACNGKKRQKGPVSVREARTELKELRGLLGDMRQAGEMADGLL